MALVCLIAGALALLVCVSANGQAFAAIRARHHAAMLVLSFLSVVAMLLGLVGLVLALALALRPS